MRLSVAILAFLLAVLLVGDVASAGLSDTIWALAPEDAQICGTGVALAFEIGPEMLLACVPLVAPIVVNSVGTQVSKLVFTNAPNLKKAIKNNPSNPNGVNGLTFYLNNKKGYTDKNGLHCFYTSRFGGDQIEQIFPPYDANQFKNKVPPTITCKVINKKTPGCINRP